MASRHDFKTEGRSIWWWILCAPGAALLWFQYMNPSSTRDSFGSARRKDVAFFQFLATLVVYSIVFLALTHMDVTRNAIHILAAPFVTMFNLLFGK